MPDQEPGVLESIAGYALAPVAGIAYATGATKTEVFSWQILILAAASESETEGVRRG